MTVESFGGTSQSANIFGEMKDKFALVGSFIPSGSKPPVEYTYGVLSSVDSGATWTLSATTPLPYARYGAFPSDNIWYVSGGTWGADPQAQRTEGSFPLSSRFQIVNGTIVEMPLRPHPKRTNADTPTGWFGYIAKTTDGGKSWSQVFSSDFNNDYYYFNEASALFRFFVKLYFYLNFFRCDYIDIRYPVPMSLSALLSLKAIRLMGEI